MVHLLYSQSSLQLVVGTAANAEMGEPMAAIMVNNLNEIRKNFAYSDGDRPMFFIHAIRDLCESKKDRSSDLLKNIVIKSFAMGKLPKVPDYAIDKHTQRGLEMGEILFISTN